MLCVRGKALKQKKQGKSFFVLIFFKYEIINLNLNLKFEKLAGNSVNFKFDFKFKFYLN